MPRKLLTLAPALLALPLLMQVGCKANSQKLDRTMIATDVTIDQPLKGRPTLQMPLNLPGSDVRVVPLSVDRTQGWFEKADRFGTADSVSLDQISKAGSPRINRQTAASYRSLDRLGIARSVRWHNAVFQPVGEKGWLALTERGLISRFEIIGEYVQKSNAYELKPKAIMLTATVEDTNGDGVLTSADAHVLLVGDKDGRGMHKITPPGTIVRTRMYHQQKNELLLMVVSDSNKDGKFTAADSAAPYIYTPGEAGMAKPLVDPALADQAEQLLK